MWFIISMVVTIALLVLKLAIYAVIPWWVVPLPILAWLVSVLVVIASFAISGYIVVRKIWKTLKAYMENQKASQTKAGR